MSEDRVEQRKHRMYEKAFKRGYRQGLIESALTVLNAKFKIFPESYVEKIKALEKEELCEIIRNIFNLEQIEDIERFLK